MAVILTILKIIGLILLWLLGILLVLLLLLLFVPIRYSLSGDYRQGNEPHATALVRYLFPLVSVKVRLNPPDKDKGAKKGDKKKIASSGDQETPGHDPSKVRLEGGVRILGIRILNLFPTEEEKERARIKKEKKLAKKAAREAKKGKGKKGSEDAISELEQEILSEREDSKQSEAGLYEASPKQGAAGQQQSGADGKTDANADGININEEADSDEDKKSGEGPSVKKPILETIRLIALAMPDQVGKALDQVIQLMDRADGFWDRVEEKKQAFSEKLQKYSRLYRRIRWLWDKDYTQRAIDKIKRCVIKILKSVCPKKGHVKVAAGMDDVAATGQMAGYYGILYGALYPFIGKHVVLEPDFEEKTLDVDGWLKGRIRLYILIRPAWLYFIDRDVKNLKKAVKTVQNEMQS